MRDAMSVLIRPVVSEKSYSPADKSVYVFIVDPRATKIEVRHAVEQAFSVRGTAVNTLNRKGKAIAKSAHQREGQAARHQARHRDAPSDDSIDLFSVPIRNRHATSLT